MELSLAKEQSFMRGHSTPNDSENMEYNFSGVQGKEEAQGTYSKNPVSYFDMIIILDCNQLSNVSTAA